MTPLGPPRHVDGVTGAAALVTGAARGIGRAIAETLAEAGASVALVDLDPLVERAAAEIARGGPAVTAMTADVTDAPAVAAAFDHAEARFGPLAVVVHAAGVLRAGSALDPSPDDWEHCLAGNARGTRNVAGEAARRMAARGGGAITVVASNAATTPRIGLAAYGASKAAAAAYTRALGLEVAGRGVRCNLLSPGSTDTGMLRRSWIGDADLAGTIAGDPAAFRLGIPLGRIADPRDVAEAALFLSSAAARHITLHDLRVDGGATLDM